MSWDTDLQEPAYSIAAAEEASLRVVAGPGTGKSYTLQRRVQRLLETGVDPERIFVSTFTRTAATDLSNSLAGIGVEGVEDIEAETLHSFAFRLLLKDDVLEITGRTPRPLLGFEEKFMQEDLNQRTAHDDNDGIRKLKKKLKAFSGAWARLQHEEPGWAEDAGDQEFERELMRWLRFHNAMVIGEIVPQALQYLRDNPASPYRNQFDYVLVDEYQDLNKAEQVLVDLIAQQNLTIIGDEDQSIYSFKCAHPEGIVEFPQTHPDTRDAGLEVCRRCPQQIVRMANSLIQHNPGRANRLLQEQVQPRESDAHIVQWNSDENEARGIAALIHQRIANEVVTAGDILVLSPRRAFARALQQELTALDVVSHTFFTEEMVDGRPQDVAECQAQEAVTLLALCADPEDRVALRCWVGFGSSTLRSGGWARVQRYAEENNLAPRAILERMAAGELTIAHTGEIVARFRVLQERLNAVGGLLGDALVDAIFPAGTEWADTFRVVLTGKIAASSAAIKVHRELRQAITQPELPMNVDYVRIMSLHKSKGLTARMVVVLGCMEGILPLIKADDTPQVQARLLEEQRRLFYVAITRSTYSLVLSSVVRMPLGTAMRMNIAYQRREGNQAVLRASRFIGELGRHAPQPVAGQRFLEQQNLAI